MAVERRRRKLTCYFWWCQVWVDENNTFNGCPYDTILSSQLIRNNRNDVCVNELSAKSVPKPAEVRSLNSLLTHHRLSGWGVLGIKVRWGEVIPSILECWTPGSDQGFICQWIVAAEFVGSTNLGTGGCWHGIPNSGGRAVHLVPPVAQLGAARRSASRAKQR